MSSSSDSMALDRALTVLFLILHILWWPLSKILAILLFILAPFYRVGVFLLLPFIHAGRTILNVLSFPFSVRWLERIETLYVYLGTAALVGVITGTFMYIIFRLLSSTLHIDASVASKPRENGRTPAEFREARRVKREEPIDHSPAAPVTLKKVPGSRRRGLMSSAIIEEEDSDF